MGKKLMQSGTEKDLIQYFFSLARIRLFIVELLFQNCSYAGF
jgi:hypothetical protein